MKKNDIVGHGVCSKDRSAQSKQISHAQQTMTAVHAGPTLSLQSSDLVRKTQFYHRGKLFLEHARWKKLPVFLTNYGSLE